MLQIDNVKIELEQTDYTGAIARQLQVERCDIQEVKLVKQALDARRKKHIHYRCSFTFTTTNPHVLQHSLVRQVETYSYPKGVAGAKTIMIVGSGPAGLFCAYQLARSHQKVIVIEQGEDVDARNATVQRFFAGGPLDKNSNVQFGEGGAGTYSDGKLTTGNRDFRKQFILETFVKHGAKPDILYQNKPHVGTDYLSTVVKNMRNYIIDHGGEVWFNTKLVDIHIEQQAMRQVAIKQNNIEKIVPVDSLVLAIGHSARDTYEMLYERGIPMETKPFAVGLRIEHLQSFINQTQYGTHIKHQLLPAADYKLATSTRQHRGVYTFCMCPGGTVINASSEPHRLVVNGMSYQARDHQNANSAILVAVNQDDFGSIHPLAGISWQRQLEQKAYEMGGNNGMFPAQRVEDFLSRTVSKSWQEVQPTIQPGAVIAPLHTLFSDSIYESMQEGLQWMDTKLPGFCTQAILTGVESRSSAPVRIIRKEDMESEVKGIYPIGEGAGYAGGIMSSAIDGLRLAEKLLIGEK